MPRFEPPSNDAQRLTFLKRAAATGTDDLAAGNAYVSQGTLDAVNAFLPDFAAAVNALSDKLGARTKEIHERAAALEQLKFCTRDLWEVLKRRARRQGQPAVVLQFYQLPLDGTTPKPTTREEWLTLAGRVVQGDADAVAAGFPPMANPSAAELQAVLEAARSEAGDVAMADRAYDQAQAAVAALRSRADELAAEVMAELRFYLRKEQAPSQRRILRTYGARFRYLPGEPQDEGADEPPVDEPPVVEV